MLLRRQLGNRSRFFDRVSLMLSAILVFFIYNHSKSSSSCSILLEKEQSRFANRTRKNLNVSRKSLEYKFLFNPLRESAPSVNDVMMAYAHGYSGLPDTTNKLPIKKILFWNEAYGSKDYGIGFGQEGFQRLNCPISDCFTTENRTLLNSVEDFDAIVIHLRTFNVNDLPSVRSQKQRWIYWSLESPQYNMQDIYPLNGLFNWTMTYRLDSDVVQPYGWVQPTGSFSIRPEQQEINKEMQLAVGRKRKSTMKKTKLVAWFVSNCQSKSRRERYANALAKHIQIDVYGNCGTFYCDRASANDCYDMLEQDYKFYFAFENSFCDDYVTEKLFSILKLDIVPIVFGGANYSAIAPPFSYIDAQSFKSARQLANYLRVLDSNDDLYNQYFWWKPHYRIRNHVQDLQLSMCGLCSRLHLDTALKTYDDMEKWWVRDSHCHTPREDNVFRIPFWTD